MVLKDNAKNCSWQDGRIASCKMAGGRVAGERVIASRMIGGRMAGKRIAAIRMSGWQVA